MKYKFQIEKKTFEIEVANTATFFSETTLKINKKNLNVMVSESRAGQPSSVFLNNKLYYVEVTRDKKGYPTGIYVNDQFYPAALLKIDQLFNYTEAQSQKSKRSGKVHSFIPGYIKKVYFSENDRVKEGDIILIHEAMKMENEIRAPISGIVKSFGVSEGDNILDSHLLFEIE